MTTPYASLREEVEGTRRLVERLKECMPLRYTMASAVLGVVLAQLTETLGRHPASLSEGSTVEGGDKLWTNSPYETRCSECAEPLPNHLKACTVGQRHALGVRVFKDAQAVERAKEEVAAPANTARCTSMFGGRQCEKTQGHDGICMAAAPHGTYTWERAK